MNIFELFKESFGVGVVASKKQAKDPRYSHSLTKDVRPDTPKKNRKALGLTESPRADGSFENRDEYYKEMYPMALKAISKLGLQIPPELLLTQWGWESDWGSKVSGDNNFFGIKANKGYKGDSKEVATHEYEDGKKVNIKDKFRSYDSLDDAVDDYVDFIKNNPRYTEAGVFDAKNSEEYMAALQKAGYATDPKYAEQILKQEKITKKQIAKVVPPEEQEKLKAEQPTVAVTPATDTPEYDAFGNVVNDKGFDPDNKKAQQATNQAARIAKRQSAEDQKRAELEKISQSRGQSVSPALDAERRDNGAGTASPPAEKPEAEKKPNVAKAKTREELEAEYQAQAEAGADTATLSALAKQIDAKRDPRPKPEDEKTDAEKIEDEIPTGVSWAQGNVSDAEEKLRVMQTNGTTDEIADAEKELADAEQTLQFNQDLASGKGMADTTPLVGDQAEYMKAKQGALMGGDGDTVTSLADLDNIRRKKEVVAKTLEKRGDAEGAAAQYAEAGKVESLRQQYLDKGITYGQGTREEQEAKLAQWEKTEQEGGDPTTSWGGGAITDPAKKEEWQKNQTAADEKQKEEGNWTMTKTSDDLQKEIDDDKDKNIIAQQNRKDAPDAKTSYSSDVASQGGDAEQGSGYSQGGVQKTQAQGYSSATTSQGGEVKQGSGYGQGDVTVSATPKEDPYPNPGYEGEELRIYNQLSDSQKAKVVGDFEKSKKYADNARKNITPRSGPTSIPDPKPRSLLDIKHQQTLSKIEGGTQLVDPAKAREVSKVLGMSARTPEDKKKRDAALDAIRFKAPSMAELQKGMTPIVDKSINKDEKTNANVPAADTSDAQSSIGKAVQPGTNLGKDNASQQAQDLQKQKAEQEAKLAQQQAQQAQQKAEREQKAAQQKAEAEQKRQEQKAEQERKVSGSTQTVGGKVKLKPGGGPVGESAIFRAISGK